MAEKKTSSPIKWIIIVTVLVTGVTVAVLAAGGIFGKNQRPALNLTRIQLKEDIIV